LRRGSIRDKFDQRKHHDRSSSIDEGTGGKSHQNSVEVSNSPRKGSNPPLLVQVKKKKKEKEKTQLILLFFP